MLRIAITPFCSLRVDHVLSILLLQSLLCSGLQGLQVFFLKVVLVDRQVLLHPFAEHHRVKATGNPHICSAGRSVVVDSFISVGRFGMR